MAASIEKRIERLEQQRQSYNIEEEAQKELAKRSHSDFMNKFLRYVDSWLENPDKDPSNESIASLFARQAALKWASAATAEEGWAGIQEVLQKIGKASEDDPRWGGPGGHRQWGIEHGLLLSSGEKENA